MTKNENESYNIRLINNNIIENKNKSNTPIFYTPTNYNRKELLNNVFLERKIKEKGRGENNYDLKGWIKNAMKTFLMKDCKTNNFSIQLKNYKKKITYKPIKMFNYKKDIIFNSDNNKEGLIFPLIKSDKRINNFSNNKNNSISEKSWKYQ